MSHWYEFQPMKNRLKRVQENVPSFKFMYEGQSMTVYDSNGHVIRCRTLEEGMNFCRVIESVLSGMENVVI